MVLLNAFDRQKHVYQNNAFGEMLKDAVRFFNGTPVSGLPPPEAFKGAGVYALYYIGKTGLYQKFGNEINREAYNVPIYVGKVVPGGWRQSRRVSGAVAGNVLYSRLCQHARTISAVCNLDTVDFTCRFAIFEGDVANMIAAVEAAIIARHNPLWNSVIDGFGNHDPGVRRLAGKVPAWDILHPGREWARKMSGEKGGVAELRRRVTDYMIGVRT